MSLHVRLLTTALALCSIGIAACGGVKDSPSEPTTPTGPSTASLSLSWSGT